MRKWLRREHSDGRSPDANALYRDPGTPDVRGPWHYLFWLARSQWPRVALGSFYGTLWMLLLLLPPYVIARAVDEGLRDGDTGAVAAAAAATLVLGALTAALGVLRHRTMTFVRIDGANRTVQVVARQAARLGATLPRRVATGDLTDVQGADALRIAQTLTVTGPGVGAVVAYVATAVLLFAISPLLAVVLLVGVPVMAVTIGPLLARVQKTEVEYRDQQGALTDLAGDIVAGLRVLSGIGGKAAFAQRYRVRSERLRGEGYRVASATSWVEAVATSLPTLFLAAVVWITARMAAGGSISIGDLVAVYGYVAVLVVPVSFFIEGTDDLARGLVSARRVIAVLTLEPDDADAAVESTGLVTAPRRTGDLHDPDSGVVLVGGRLTGLVAETADEASALADRLGRYGSTAATFDGVPLMALPLAEVRRRILVTGNDAHLFAGTVRSVFAHGASDADIHAALRAANAEDAVAGLPGDGDSLDGRLEPQGRNLSGGQRQRLRLARALQAAPDVAVLLEPTSAVDAHTETTIAARLRELRLGRTTLVVTTSPLLLAVCDDVVHLRQGHVLAIGTHATLCAVPSYAALVYRGEAGDDTGAAAPPALGVAAAAASAQ